MIHRLLGISAGAISGSVEILLHRALQAAQEHGAHVELVRLDDVRLRGEMHSDEPDDGDLLYDRLLDADGIIIAAPFYSRMVPAKLKLIVDRLLGANADRAIIEGLLEARRRGEDRLIPFAIDERVIKPRVAGFIAVGGALTPQWKALALPTMHLLTFSMQTAVVDQFVVSGAGTPQSVLLNRAAIDRSARLGAHVAGQMGRAFEDAVYAGDPGLCPLCHLDLMVLRGADVACGTCGATGRLRGDLTVEWTDLSTSVITMEETRAHYDEIVATAKRHAALRSEITAAGAPYADCPFLISPSDDAEPS